MECSQAEVGDGHIVSAHCLKVGVKGAGGGVVQVQWCPLGPCRGRSRRALCALHRVTWDTPALRMTPSYPEKLLFRPCHFFFSQSEAGGDTWEGANKNGAYPAMRENQIAQVRLGALFAICMSSTRYARWVAS